MNIRVRMQPYARRAGVRGIAATADVPRLGIAIIAPPEDGRANRAACAALAAALRIAASAVEVVQGGASREKLLRVAGDAALLGPRLESLA